MIRLTPGQRMKEKALVKRCQSFMQDHVQSVSGGWIFLTGVEKLHGRLSSLLQAKGIKIQFQALRESLLGA